MTIEIKLENQNIDFKNDIYILKIRLDLVLK